jgi:hypothetical protein
MQTIPGVKKAIEAVDREVARLAAHASTEEAPDLDELRTSWGRLVELLVLGPRPERRACPHCGNVPATAATRCGRCWVDLAPVQGSPA